MSIFWNTKRVEIHLCTPSNHNLLQWRTFSKLWNKSWEISILAYVLVLIIKNNKTERIAFLELTDNPHMVIRVSNKGGRSVVVLDSGLYEKQIMNMLSDQQVYQKLDADPTGNRPLGVS